MILDPFDDILAECDRLGETFALATLVPEKLVQRCRDGLAAHRPS